MNLSSLGFPELEQDSVYGVEGRIDLFADLGKVRARCVSNMER